MIETRYTTIDRDELKRLRADSAELARVRDLAKEAIDFAEELGEESDKLARYAGSTGDGGDHEKPIAELRARLGSHPAMTKPSKATEGFALVPVGVASGVVEYADGLLHQVNKLLSYAGSIADDQEHDDADYTALKNILAAAPKGDSHE